MPPTLEPTDTVMLPDEDVEEADDGVPLVRITTLPLLTPLDTPLSNNTLPLEPLDDIPDDTDTSPLVLDAAPLPTRAPPETPEVDTPDCMLTEPLLRMLSPLNTSTDPLPIDDEVLAEEAMDTEPEPPTTLDPLSINTEPPSDDGIEEVLEPARTLTLPPLDPALVPPNKLMEPPGAMDDVPTDTVASPAAPNPEALPLPITMEPLPNEDPDEPDSTRTAPLEPDTPAPLDNDTEPLAPSSAAPVDSVRAPD